MGVPNQENEDQEGGEHRGEGANLGDDVIPLVHWQRYCPIPTYPGTRWVAGQEDHQSAPCSCLLLSTETPQYTAVFCQRPCSGGASVERRDHVHALVNNALGQFPKKF
ncbi:hypothetical protein E2C01_043546 [Portunus trituberculatus]|uniref:Uncharacterized protein n=1 Tax=Portunus trituberculatus TaxID=210409 RepID=A0A5B7FWN6_PORTR|nr:hypothetical protein [Portunus trituberculatus]